jgi:citrate synthase
MVRYRGTDVLDLVKAEEPFERVADLLWQACPPGSDGGWRLPGEGEWPALRLPDEIPVLHRFAIAVASTASDVTVDTAIPDWPSRGRHVIGCLIDASGSESGNRDHPGHPDQARQAGHPGHPGQAGLPDDDATVARRLWRRWSPLPPTPARVRALDIALVLLAEHELALSTLSVRVAASARATPASCLLAGLSTLSGSLHGGAARSAHDKLAAREPVVSGFGHPVHRHGDPRVTPLLEAVREIATDEDRAVIENARRAAPRPLNVDFALGALTYAARMPAEAATAIFAIARVAGWIAHAAEEYDEPPLRFRGRAVRPARGLRSPSRD